MKGMKLFIWFLQRGILSAGAYLPGGRKLTLQLQERQYAESFLRIQCGWYRG